MLYVRIAAGVLDKKAHPRTNLISYPTKYIYCIPTNIETNKKYVPPVRVVIIHHTTQNNVNHTTTTPHQKQNYVLIYTLIMIRK
jgi:hypothetical protein